MARRRGRHRPEFRTSDPPLAGNPVRTWIRPPRPSSLPQERDQLEYSSLSLVFPNDGPRLLRAWGPPERPFVVGVASSGDRWSVAAWGTDAATARAAVRAMFSLEHPIREFYRLVRREPILRGTERRFAGLRIPRDASVYESLLYAIIGQQLSVPVARAITKRLFARVGSYLTVNGATLPRVPTSAEVARLREPGLRAVGLSGAKSRAVVALAERGTTDEFATDVLARLPVEEAVEQLDRLPGVGRWTAENALLRGAGRPDVFVAGDLGLRVALDRFGVVPRSLPEERARAWGARNYPGWGSYATLYLWRRLVVDRPSPPRSGTD
ncbi:MAG TPA: hypothetical protein VFF67_00470 [Thermoplasmata archaeon]|nr:hypothetical protein [Thermoplasmata archaeon]